VPRMHLRRFELQVSRRRVGAGQKPKADLRLEDRFEIRRLANLVWTRNKIRIGRNGRNRDRKESNQILMWRLGGDLRISQNSAQVSTKSPPKSLHISSAISDQSGCS
jgi:uncharacterized ubiquitin-like protein YukD